jgi:MraZ protein
MFRGRYEHTIDPKGRLSVPARFRDVLARYEGPMVVVPNDHALEVHPLPEWERLEARIGQHPSFSQEVRRLGRLFISRAKEVPLDNVGRILLPPDSREQAGLDRDVTLVGPGLPFFEVWDRRRFEEYERSNGDGLTSLFDRLAQLGV